jgi:hypothetical protein
MTEKKVGGGQKRKWAVGSEQWAERIIEEN